jgi:hypothetical protein
MDYLEKGTSGAAIYQHSATDSRVNLKYIHVTKTTKTNKPNNSCRNIIDQREGTLQQALRPFNFLIFVPVGDGRNFDKPVCTANNEPNRSQSHILVRANSFMRRQQSYYVTPRSNQPTKLHRQKLQDRDCLAPWHAWQKQQPQQPTIRQNPQCAIF